MVAAAVVASAMRKTGLGKNDRKKFVMRRYDDGLDPFYTNISTSLVFVFFSLFILLLLLQHKHQQHQLPTKKHNPSTLTIFNYIPKARKTPQMCNHIRILLRPRITEQEREREAEQITRPKVSDSKKPI